MMNNNKEEIQNAFYYANLVERIMIRILCEKYEAINIVKCTPLTGYSVFDAYATSGDSLNIAIEAKVQNKYSIDDYPTGMLKVKKFNRIMKKINSKEYKDKNVKPILIYFYKKDNKCAIWDLTTASKEIVYRTFSKYTVTQSENELTELYLFPLSEAQIINL